MTIKDAIQNIDMVVSSTKMSRQEHEALMQSIKLVADTCNEVEDLRKEVTKLELDLENAKKEQ